MWKPELMFSKDGTWKEFGLGRNSGQYTWIPFWLFAIMWAIMSYIIVLVVASHTGIGGVSNNAEVEVHSIEPENISSKSFVTPNKKSGSKNNKLQQASQQVSQVSKEMKHGYYILDTNETMKNGAPKYIFLGPDTPNLVYHNSPEASEDN
jgi:hypothetical protein